MRIERFPLLCCLVLEFRTMFPEASRCSLPKQTTSDLKINCFKFGLKGGKIILTLVKILCDNLHICHLSENCSNSILQGQTLLVRDSQKQVAQMFPMLLNVAMILQYNTYVAIAGIGPHRKVLCLFHLLS